MSGSSPVTATSGPASGPQASGPFTAAFERLGAALSAVVLHQQEALSEVLPREDWNADLTARTYTSGGVTVRVSLLGSFAEQERTWLWGWANTQFGPDHPAVVPTLAIREIGDRLGIPELITPEIDLSRYDGPAGHGGELIAVAATGLLRGGGYIGAGYPGGSAYLHVDDPRVPQAGWDPITTPRLIVNAISLFPVDHRLTVARFLSHHRIAYRETPGGIEAWPPGSGPTRATFDESDRFTGWNANLPAPATPAPAAGVVDSPGRPLGPGGF